ncbi:hypothetical protein MUK42_01930, partial [Musa troglodytarum]
RPKENIHLRAALRKSTIFGPLRRGSSSAVRLPPLANSSLPPLSHHYCGHNELRGSEIISLAARQPNNYKMKREGRQHGIVRSSAILPQEFNPRPNSKIVNCVGAPTTTRFFTKAPSKPTNHSKCTSKCRTARCKGCHSNPMSKSRDKAKGAYKLKSCDVVLNHQLVAWRVVNNSGSLLNYKVASASETLDHLYADGLCEGEDYDDHNTEENLDYDYGEVFPETIDFEVGCKGAKVEFSPDSDEAGDTNFYVVGMSWDYSDGEWLVVGEI